jgi:hypothetical protein
MMIKEPTAPASPAQVSYLEALVKDRDLPLVCERYALLTELGALTKGRASEFIDQLLTAPKKTVKATVMSQPAPAAPVLQPKIELGELPAFGYYWITGVDGAKVLYLLRLHRQGRLPPAAQAADRDHLHSAPRRAAGRRSTAATSGAEGQRDLEALRAARATTGTNEKTGYGHHPEGAGRGRGRRVRSR